MILIAALLLILFATVTSGLKEVLFRHSETHDLLSLRTMILRRNRDQAFQVLAVVSSPWSPPKLDGIIPEIDDLSREAPSIHSQDCVPQLHQLDLDQVDELFSLPEGPRLIILAGTEQRLSSSDQLRLGIESIHPGVGILNAYATVRSRQPRH